MKVYQYNNEIMCYLFYIASTQPCCIHVENKNVIIKYLQLSTYSSYQSIYYEPCPLDY